MKLHFSLRQLIEHNSDDPAIAAGSSHINFTEDQGNFIIKEDVFEKIELSTCDTDLSGMPILFKARCYNAEYFPEITVSCHISTCVEKLLIENLTV